MGASFHQPLASTMHWLEGEDCSPGSDVEVDFQFATVLGTVLHLYHKIQQRHGAKGAVLLGAEQKAVLSF